MRVIFLLADAARLARAAYVLAREGVLSFVPPLALPPPARPLLKLARLIARPDGSEVIATERRGSIADAAALGRDAGEELKRRGGPGFFAD
ncbi:MAG: hypothetical protein B7Z40_23025 [Bosea sp. 12-68-7]|nr:MAG: hypothetical protein B7Z40_23025 [Bosea sp. 12-68-7]